MSQAFFALEISSDGVRACRFSREGRQGTRLREMVLRPPEEDKPVEAQALAALEALGADKGPVHVCLPAWDFMIRNMTLPFKGTGRISQILPMEMGAGLGVSPDSCEIAFLETKKSATGTGVLALALEKGRAEGLIQTLGEAGYFVEALAVSQLAAASALAAMDKTEGAWGLVDTRGALVLMSGSRALGLRVFPGVDQGEDRLAGTVSTVLSEICGLRYPEITLDKLRIMGPCADALALTLESRLGIPAQGLNPADSEGPDPERVLAGDAGGVCAVFASWAAIRGKAAPRFRERGWRVDHFFASHGKALIGSGVLTLLVLVLLGAHLVLDMQRLRRQDRMLDAEIRRVFTATLPDVTRIVDPLHQMRIHLAELEQASAFAASGSADHRMVELLRGLVRSAPEGAPMHFTRLAITGDQLTLSGETDTYNHVDALKNRLSAQPFFSGVTITQATADQEEGRVRFNLRSDLR
ncbi:PilN domain-containing protein [Desulfobotulus sp.]|jgi:Tfp pilus assembly protein PilN|uniref:PilN domain-containing protein n=1 Tax=Desulfobotulus sp. TaxID=1940337 RepID=UPI002A364B50|nr:PilN domain-containing protein [Desulfobotulus sp.]MDY0162514.1 PilN domain-containing protein [Desulfobotulus sp.]